MPGKQVTLYASASMMMGSRPGQPIITRGEAHDEQHYFAGSDGSLLVHEVDVEDFLAMGCTREPQEPPKVVNHVEPG